MKRIILILFLLVCNYCIRAQVNIQWSIQHHPLGVSQNFAFIENDQLYLDKQFNIIGGWQFTGASYPNGALGITKYNTVGSQIWEHDYSGTWGGNNLFGGGLDDSGNVYVNGVINSSSFAQMAVSIKYNSGGNQEWIAQEDSGYTESASGLFLNESFSTLSRAFGYIKSYDLNGLLQDSISVDSTYYDTTTMQGYGTRMYYLRTDGKNLYALGTWNIAFSPDLQYYLVKVDSSRNRLWTKIINPGSGHDQPVELVADENKNIFLTGNVDLTSPTRKIFTCALDSAGDTLWTRGFNPNMWYASDIEVDNLGHVYVAVKLYNTITTRLTAAIIQYDAITGNQNWVQSFDSSTTTQSKDVKLIIDSLGSIYLAYGMGGNSNPGVSINKIDSMGTVLWHTSFDTLGGVNSFVSDNSGNFYVGGGKLTKFSVVTSTNENQFNAAALLISPNPAHNQVTITALNFTNSILTLYNITGRELLQQTFNTQVTIDTGTLTSGVYIVEVRDKEGRSVKGKVVKE